MFGLEDIGKPLILGGIFLILFGLLFTFWHEIPLLGKLPGGIFIQKGNFRFFFPLVTCLIISAGLTILFNIVLKLFR
jgi:hypothetical protein